MENSLIIDGIAIQAGKYFLGWGTLCLINAVLAQGKNRSGLIWFIISIVLGPVATLFLALLEKKPQVRKHE
ncbi:MAG: hypothetical protein KAH00_04245 [Cocleimonas sp.]|nr:hypothetical protein [Cocleimonas sp.]